MAFKKKKCNYSIAPFVWQTRIEKSATSGLGQYHQSLHSPLSMALSAASLFTLYSSVSWPLTNSLQCGTSKRAASTYVLHDTLQYCTAARAGNASTTVDQNIDPWLASIRDRQEIVCSSIRRSTWIGSRFVLQYLLSK